MGGKNTLLGHHPSGPGHRRFGTFLLRQQLLALPVRRSSKPAEIDGAGHWRRLWQIVVPVSVPDDRYCRRSSTVFSEWNDYLWPLIITDDPDTHDPPGGPDPAAATAKSMGPVGVSCMAGSVPVIVPVLLVFASSPALHRCRAHPRQCHRLLRFSTHPAPSVWPSIPLRTIRHRSTLSDVRFVTLPTLTAGISLDSGPRRRTAALAACGGPPAGRCTGRAAGSRRSTSPE